MNVGVDIFPSKTVGVPGNDFLFVCSDPSHTASSVQWLVNGTLLENSTLENVFQEFNDRSKTADLSFNLPLEHNVTTIQCIGNFASENVSSETVTLLLQGQLKTIDSPEFSYHDGINFKLFVVIFECYWYCCRLS